MKPAKLRMGRATAQRNRELELARKTHISAYDGLASFAKLKVNIPGRARITGSRTRRVLVCARPRDY